jgi:hypothetical protein
MLINLVPLNTPLSRIQEIPTTFFQNIEEAEVFDDNLFPPWTDTAFSETDLKKKFKSIYDKYKLLVDPLERQKVINAFINNNLIANLCNNDAGTICIVLRELHESIRTEIDTAFLYLYKTAINYHGFETFVNDNVSKAIDRFIESNRMQVCPFCGLEGYSNLEGQSRIPLDHWLCKDLFPVTAVNFDNLIPIGTKCNERPAKGDTNILLDDLGNRKRSFYPFVVHHEVVATFRYNALPSLNPMIDADWDLTIAPTEPMEQELFNSWNSVFNILTRYKDYYRKYVYPLWENEYKAYIEDAGIGHAQNVEELKDKFRLWRASFPLRSRSASLLYRVFIDNMVNNVSDAYLYSLCENFKR